MAKTIEEKLAILTQSAKYDVSCSSSGARSSSAIGAASPSGICHSFSADGRCVSLLKVLLTNICIYDCAYCINRMSNEIPRAILKPKELATLTIEFYKRNFVEGLFLSSAVIKNPDFTMELILQTLQILRYEYSFGGYIHAKLIPGADERLIEKVTMLASRVSSNIELPSNRSLALFAPGKSKSSLLAPLKQARNLALIKGNAEPLMSTQLIIGATPESDWEILRLSESLYQKALLKRVYYSAYIPVNGAKGLPALHTPPPLLREHRLYQADWLLRFYGFGAEELVDSSFPHLDSRLDPKSIWALRNLNLFPIEINKASKEILLRVPGFGVQSVMRIIRARRFGGLSHENIKELGISLKRAQYFITCKGKYLPKFSCEPESIWRKLCPPKQLRLFEAC